MTDPAVTILVLAPNWLGDAIMASPLVSRLAAARDAAGRRPRVHLAVRDVWRCLFEGDPRLAGLVAIERDGAHRGLRGQWLLGRTLRALGARAVVVGPPSLRAAAHAVLSGARVRAGHRGDGRSLLLAPAVERPRRGSRHHAEELRDLADVVLARLGMTPGPAAVESSWPLLPALAAGERLPADRKSDGASTWIFAPGSTYGEAKVWPVAQARAFVDLAVNVRGKRVVLLGDRAAGSFAAAMREGSAAPWCADTGGGPGVVDRTGATSLIEAAGLLRRAEAFVGNDSGLMHLAGALGTATVGLFGSTDPGWTAPLGPRTAVVAAEGFACRPCFRRTCNQPEFCLATVGPEAALTAVDELLAAGAEGRTR